MTGDRIYALALSFIPQVGSVQARQLVSHFGSPKAVFEASRKELIRIKGIGTRKIEEIANNKVLDKAAAEYERTRAKGIRMLFYQDKDYPERLRHYPDSPVVLYQKGNALLNGERYVSIIGTRQPTEYGRKMCAELVEGLTALDCIIISGLAYGIDSMAHRYALKAGLDTIGVLGSGLDWIYPASNRKMAMQMESQGCLLSEFVLGTKPDRENFPKRNRIIAGMADALIVIESARKGGSMITVEYANSYNKDVFAVPGRTTDSYSAGCNHLIKAHKAQLISCAGDITYIMRWQPRSSHEQMKLHLELSEDEKLIYEFLKKKKKAGLDSLHYFSSMSLSSLNTILLNLEFKGLVKSGPGKLYTLN